MKYDSKLEFQIIPDLIYFDGSWEILYLGENLPNKILYKKMTHNCIIIVQIFIYNIISWLKHIKAFYIVYWCNWICNQHKWLISIHVSAKANKFLNVWNQMFVQLQKKKIIKQPKNCCPMADPFGQKSMSDSNQSSRVLSKDDFVNINLHNCN